MQIKMAQPSDRQKSKLENNKGLKYSQAANGNIIDTTDYIVKSCISYNPANVYPREILPKWAPGNCQGCSWEHFLREKKRETFYHQ